METSKKIGLVLILAVVLSGGGVYGKSASVLLQEGLYAEETEGDLDKAVGIYEQLLEEYKEIERLAGRATYRLGMCYLKKGDKQRAAEYFTEVVSKYPGQAGLVKRARGELRKLEPVEDVIARSYVIHYKAVDQSRNALKLLNKNHPKGVRTHHANRYRKDGVTINSICTDTAEGKEKIVAAIKASDELEFVKVENPKHAAKTKSIFEQIDYQVIQFLGEQFGKTALEAGQQHLMVNSHIYYVEPNGFRYRGGMNAYYNWTGRTITQKVHFGGTSYPNQTHYGVDGNKLNTEIVPDKTRPNHWQIYWIPDEPLAPEESLYYGWSMNDKRKIPKLPGDVYSLTMQNKHGAPVIETFFLVLPKDLKISQSNTPTGNQELLGFNVYWWTKTVQQGENHVEKVQLQKKAGQEHWQQKIYEISDNMAIDLDTALAIALSKDWPIEYDVAWDNDAGGVLMVRPNSSVRIIGLPAIEKGDFGKAIESAKKSAELLQNSPARGMPANQSTFCAVLTDRGKLTVVEFVSFSREKAQLSAWQKEKTKSRIDLSSPGATIKSFMKAVYNGNVDGAMACVSKDGHDYGDLKEMLTTKSNHPIRDMIKAMDTNIGIYIVSTNIKDGKCGIVWRLTFGRDFHFGEMTMRKGTTYDFDGNLKLVGDEWMIMGI